MKVLLVAIHSKYIHSSLAVWYLKAAAQPFADIVVLESTIKADKTKLLQEIRRENANLVAFSCYIWNISFVEEMVLHLKKEPPAPLILLGGPEVSYRTETIFSKPTAPDYILCGEGEEPFSQLLQALSSKQNVAGIPGLCTKQTQAQPHISQNDPPSPYSAEYFNKLNGRIAYIETSRGCPYSCSYCLSGRMGKVRFFSLSEAEKHLEFLANSGTQTIKFVDRTFNCNSKRALHILRYLLEKNPVYRGVCYHFEMAGDLLNPEMLAVLNAAPKGLFQVEIGVQSFNEATLCAVQRKTDLALVCENLQNLLCKGNVHVHVDLIAGLPFEDFASFRKGFDSLFSLRPHKLQLGFLKRLHGSPLEHEDVGRFSKTPPYQVIATPWLSEQELLQLQQAEDALDRLYNSGRFKSLVFAALFAKHSAFDLFLDFGTKHRASYGETPDDYATKALAYFSGLLGEEPTRDLMKEQWLKVNSSGRMPACLQDKTQKGILKKTEQNDPRKPSIKRSAVVLYGTNEIVYVDYTDKDPVTKEYSAKKIPWI